MRISLSNIFNRDKDKNNGRGNAIATNSCTLEEKLVVEKQVQFSQDTRDPFFIFNHIPKTDGTTFSEILQKNFKEKFDSFASAWIHMFPNITKEQIEKYTFLYNDILASASHSFRLDEVPFNSITKRFIIIAYVRNPIDMYLSCYFFFRNRNLWINESQPERKYILGEYIEKGHGANISYL